jgi:hypothetical protein
VVFTVCRTRRPLTADLDRSATTALLGVPERCVTHSGTVRVRGASDPASFTPGRWPGDEVEAQEMGLTRSTKYGRVSLLLVERRVALRGRRFGRLRPEFGRCDSDGPAYGPAVWPYGSPHHHPDSLVQTSMECARRMDYDTGPERSHAAGGRSCHRRRIEEEISPHSFGVSARRDGGRLRGRGGGPGHVSHQAVLRRTVRRLPGLSR